MSKKENQTKEEKKKPFVSARTYATCPYVRVCVCVCVCVCEREREREESECTQSPFIFGVVFLSFNFPVEPELLEHSTSTDL